MSSGGGSRAYPIGLVAGSTIGLTAAVALIVERIALLEDPDRVLTCDINPIISCGSVMTTPQAEALGIPNPIIGIAGFASLLTVGVVLTTGASLPRWFHLGVAAGTTFGVAFVHWLIFQSLYRIGALCPYCVVVWAVTIPLFVTTMAHLVRTQVTPVAGPRRRLAHVLVDYQAVIITAWYLTIAALVARRFWTYWETLLP